MSAQSTWMENDAQWYEQRMVFCDLCGRMIAKRFLRARVDGEDRTFCSTDCEQLYGSYWLGVRAAEARPANVGELYAERMVK